MALKKIGFFGGTFDPIHNGHLNLAISIKEAHQLDEIFICPAFYSPFKADATPVSKEHRLKMLELAIEGLDYFKIIDLELKREGSSFTIDTVRQLIDMYKNCSFQLILGEDALVGLERWKNVEELLKLAPPLVGARPSEIKNLKPEIKNLVVQGVVRIPLMEISSTEIRQRLLQGKFCGHLLPGKVLDYIYENHLYY